MAGRVPAARKMAGGRGAMDVPEIDVDELERRLEEGAVLIDVREPDEWSRFACRAGA